MVTTSLAVFKILKNMTKFTIPEFSLNFLLTFDCAKKFYDFFFWKYIFYPLFSCSPQENDECIYSSVWSRIYEVFQVQVAIVTVALLWRRGIHIIERYYLKSILNINLRKNTSWWCNTNSEELLWRHTHEYSSHTNALQFPSTLPVYVVLKSS